MLIAQSEGLHPVTALKRYHIMEDGRPSMKSEVVLAEFQNLGGDVEWITEADDRLQQRGRWTYKGKTKEIGFTIIEAQAAGYVKDKSNWVKDPASQLRARAVTRAVRMLAPQVLGGLRTPEELADIPPDPAPSWTPATAATPSPAPAAETAPQAAPGLPAPASGITTETAAKALAADHLPAVASGSPAAADPGHKPATDEGVPGLFGPDDAPIVLAYLVKLAWIRPGQTFLNLNKGHEARIRKGLSAFLDAARKSWAADQSTQNGGK